eukprot:612132_1
MAEEKRNNHEFIWELKDNQYTSWLNQSDHEDKTFESPHFLQCGSRWCLEFSYRAIHHPNDGYYEFKSCGLKWQITFIGNEVQLTLKERSPSISSLQIQRRIQNRFASYYRCAASAHINKSYKNVYDDLVTYVENGNHMNDTVHLNQDELAAITDNDELRFECTMNIVSMINRPLDKVDTEQKHDQNDEKELIERDATILKLKAEIADWKKRYNSLKQNNETLLDKQRTEIDILMKELVENNEAKENKDDSDSDDEKCRTKFKEWLSKVVKLRQYLPNFEENECDDIRLIEFFEEEVLKNEIGINKTFHRKLLMKEANEFKRDQAIFSEVLVNNKELERNKQIFQANGILTLRDFRNDIETPRQLGEMLQIMDEKKVRSFWITLQQTEDGSAKQNNEGHPTEYH